MMTQLYDFFNKLIDDRLRDGSFPKAVKSGGDEPEAPNHVLGVLLCDWGWVAPVLAAT